MCPARLRVDAWPGPQHGDQDPRKPCSQRRPSAGSRRRAAKCPWVPNPSCVSYSLSVFSRSFPARLLNQSRPCYEGRLSVPGRALLLVCALGLLGPLALATHLKPDSQGFGTHRQLGLRPCAFLTVFGVRCPICGMTTSWACVVRGQLPSALRANAAGALLACLAMCVGPWATASAIWGRWVLVVPSDRLVIGTLAAIWTLTMLVWIGRLITG